MTSFFLSLSLYLCSFILSVRAANDWSKPCLSGVCQYDLPSSNTGYSGTLSIFGASNAIGDITPAAGWAILSCSPDALDQTIHIACADETSLGCAHLFGNTTNPDGAVGKVVRLPETCGKNAFAVVTLAKVAEDQSIPASMVSSLTRRDGKVPIVHSLQINTSIAGSESLPVEQQVRFSIIAANGPGATSGPLSHNVTGKNASSEAFLGGAIAKLKSLKDSFNKTFSLPPIDINKNFSLLSESISCPPEKASISIGVDSVSHADVSFGVAASGTILPPKVDSVSLSSTFSANIDATVMINTNVSGTLDTGKLTLFQAPIGPGLDFPGILSIGPTFQLNTRATANLTAFVDMQVGINYNISQASFTFPHQTAGGSGSFLPSDTPIMVNAIPSPGNVAVHVTPTISFGISTFTKDVNANIFVDVDGSAYSTISLTPTKPATEVMTPREDQIIPPFRFARGTLPQKRDDVSLQGCFETDALLSVNVGADGDFFNLFNANTTIPLFSRNFQLFKKCFGSSLSRRSLPSPVVRREPLGLYPAKRSDLQCTPDLPLSPITIVDQVISALSVGKT